MQIIIPMSGFGERFRSAGYTVPKPLIEIQGKPIIAHVIDMFPDETDFIFICNRTHLDHPEYRMREILARHCPQGQIVSIESHRLGPVHAVMQALPQVKLDGPVVVNYCDFTCYWDWHHFKAFAEKSNCAGAIPAYRGFHPHSLGSTNYAYMQESGGWVQDIQEKRPYTDNRMMEYASSGTYYFASGRLMAEAFSQTIADNVQVGGEFYVSLAYKPLLAQSLPVAVYPLQHFMQWGTPQDVAEYNYWSHTFERLLRPAVQTPPCGSVVLPMAGLGKRFSDEGYRTTKPLIPVSGKPMVVQAIDDLPVASQYAFVLRKDMDGAESLTTYLSAAYPQSTVTELESLTEGQACTSLLGLQALQSRFGTTQGPVTFGACDNGALYESQALQALLVDPDIDIIVWGVRGYANAGRRPQMYGWIDVDENNAIRNISVKSPLGNPAIDPIVIGTFTFKNAQHFVQAVQHLLNRNGRVNGEFYLDSCINDAIELGLKCVLFEVGSFICWGTPNDLKTFEYWQSCFHKWHAHPYRLELDHRVATQSLDELIDRYQHITPCLPEMP